MQSGQVIEQAVLTATATPGPAAQWHGRDPQPQPRLELGGGGRLLSTPWCPGGAPGRRPRAAHSVHSDAAALGSRRVHIACRGVWCRSVPLLQEQLLVLHGEQLRQHRFVTQRTRRHQRAPPHLLSLSTISIRPSLNTFRPEIVNGELKFLLGYHSM